jgi:hypothetical protein
LPVDISGIVSLLNKNDIFKKDDFDKGIKLSSEYLDRCFSVNNFNDGIQDDDIHNHLLSNKQPKSFYDRRNKRTKVLYCPLILKYLFVKMCYLLVSIGVFFLAAQFLQMKEPDSFYKFGFDTASRWIEQSMSEHDSKEYLNSKFLPRVIFCGNSFIFCLKSRFRKFRLEVLFLWSKNNLKSVKKNILLLFC